MSTTDSQTGRPTKPCGAPGCHTQIVRRTKASDTAWEKVRYCSRRCTGIAASARHAQRPAPTESRPCGYSGCDRIITRRRGESPTKWRDHRFCSTRCVIDDNAEKSRKPESDETRPCGFIGCTTGIRRKRTHSDAAWEKIRFCSTAHAAAARRNGKHPQRTARKVKEKRPAPVQEVQEVQEKSPAPAREVPAAPREPTVAPTPARPVWRPVGFTLRSANEYHLKQADDEECA